VPLKSTRVVSAPAGVTLKIVPHLAFQDTQFARVDSAGIGRAVQISIGALHHTLRSEAVGAKETLFGTEAIHRGECVRGGDSKNGTAVASELAAGAAGQRYTEQGAVGGLYQLTRGVKPTALVTAHLARNQSVRVLRVSWKIVPAVTKLW
jgi:hypothetical protein